MKRNNFFFLVIALTVAALPLSSIAQAAKIKMPDFSGLAAKAKESSEITLDKDMLRSAGAFVTGKVEDKAAAEQIKGIEGVYIRTFEFDKPGQYSMDDVLTMVKQVESTPGWKKLISVRDGEERTEIWMRDNDVDGGLFLVAAEPEELTVINIVGKIDLATLANLRALRGVPGVPNMGGGQ